MNAQMVEFLKKNPLFSELAEDELKKVGSLLREKSYSRNEIIFLEEDTGRFMYFVKDGRVKVSRMLPNGKEMILTFHESGEYFGELALIDGRTTPATVTAVTKTTLYILTAADFFELLKNPATNRVVLSNLCDRCRDAWAQIEVLTFHNADARIRMAFYHLAAKRGVKTEAGTVIPMKLTHRELSDIVGISRETATRVLSILQEEGLVSVDTKRFIIKDPEALIDDLLFE